MNNPHTPSPHQNISKAYQAALMAGTARSTRRAYQRDVKYFWAWANLSLNLTESYPVTLEQTIRFILDHSGQMPPPLETELISRSLRRKGGALRIKTLRRYLSSLSVAHTEHGVESPIHNPQVKLLLRRLQRSSATLPSHRKDAVTSEILKAMVATCDDSLHGIRDRAILLVGFASGGRRRSELANLMVEDLRKVDDGYIIHLRQTKTDQDGKGIDVPVLGEAAHALLTWLVRIGLRKGNLFRGILPNGKLNDGICGHSINLIIKRRAKKAGIDPAHIGAHSLRSGFITESARKGAALGDAMALSGHQSMRVAHGYYRKGELLRNPTSNLLN